MEAFLRALLPRLLPEGRTFELHPFQGKPDLLAKLEPRLRGYAAWLPERWRIVVVVDRDDDECHELKGRWRRWPRRAGLLSQHTAGTAPWQLVNRVAVEELEAWYFGDWQAVRAAYPRVSAGVRFKRAIATATPSRWHVGSLQRVLQRHGYFRTGLRKVDAARTIGGLLDPERCRSHSFATFSVLPLRGDRLRPQADALIRGRRGDAMPCKNHPFVEDRLTRCSRCAEAFCPDCIVEIGGLPYCLDCKTESMRDLRSGVPFRGSTWPRSAAGSSPWSSTS